MNKVTEIAALPSPPAYPGAGSFAHQLISALGRLFMEMGYRLNRCLPVDGSEPMTGPAGLAIYTVATRPAAADYPWSLIAVSDGGAGAEFQASNGSAWVNLG